MRLPKDILSGNYIKPRIFLCETNKEKICQLETTNTSGAFKFNSYSELSFEVGRIYNDMITGDRRINAYYEKIESPRLIYVEGLAYFELQGTGITGDGIKEAKSCTAYSLEYTLSTKYLEDFNINTGKVDSLEVLNADDPKHIAPITLYNASNTKLSLLHLVLEKVYGWKIGHVDASLHQLSRQFEVDRESVYDFLMNEVCEKFNCYIVFDTIENTINIYAESLTSKFIGDGITNTFVISPPFAKIGTVSIDGYKTSRWEYNLTTGILVLEDIPDSGAHIEVVDGALAEWETDVFVTFDNLAQVININYDSDSIKTVLTVTYGDDLNIREVNMGLPYITDISYYYTVDWMGQDLYDAYTAYMQNNNKYQSEYANNAQDLLDIDGYINFEENRLSLEYSVALSVNATTVGTYYVRGGNAPNYYYTEVSLPADYDVNTTYYSTSTVNVQDGDDGNIAALYDALQKYFYNHFNLGNDDELQDTHANGVKAALEDISNLHDRFVFMDGGSHTISGLHDILESQSSDSAKEAYIDGFFDIVWEQIGRAPLKSFYYERYKQAQIANIEKGNSQEYNVNYGFYYVTVLILRSIESAISKRNKSIDTYKAQYDSVQQKNVAITNALIIENNFTKDQMVRLSAFLREDELHLDDIVETEITTVSESFKLKQDAMETGRIELQKKSQPQLQFSMSMANIYALPEFEPIIDQFQLGNVIKVGLRNDYVKQSRLLQVNFNFDNLSDFSCEFGELTSLRTQSDIHADLLKKAVQAGKSVATNASYWTKGSEQANSIDLRLEEGLLNSIEALRAMDGVQHSYMDKYGLHLESVNPETGEVSDQRVWLVNNQIVFTDDGFKTSKSVLGKFEVDGETYYGLLAQAVIAGYIEGSSIVGGIIKIGLQEDGTYAFEVHSDGSVTMNGSSTISGYAKEDDVNELKGKATIISATEPDVVNDGQMWLNTSKVPYELMIGTDGKWEYFDQQIGGKVFTSMPLEYSEGDIWILAKGENYENYGEGSILIADENLEWVDAISDITSTIAHVKESFTWDDDGIKVMKRVTDDDGNVTNPFYVHIDSERMGFHSVEYNVSGEVKKDVEVVHIGNNSSTIQNATFEGSSGTTFDNNAQFNKQIQFGNFIWKVEDNGSLSLAISQ